MLSENNLARVIKQLAKDAVEQDDPTSVVYGTVKGVNSETGDVSLVQVDQQWSIDGDQLVLPSSFKEQNLEKVKVKGNIIALVKALLDESKVDYEWDEGCADDECIVNVTVKDFLKEGDPVIITRQQGGQRFIVTGRTNG